MQMPEPATSPAEVPPRRSLRHRVGLEVGLMVGLPAVPSPVRAVACVVGLAGLALPGCGPDREGLEPGECSNGVDEDGDGRLDCADPDCAGAPDCAQGAGTGADTDPPDVPVGDFDDVPELTEDTGTDAGVRTSKSPVWADVAAGVEHTCALRLDGTMACFGRPPTDAPEEDVTLGLEGHWSLLASGQGFSCALDAEGDGEAGIVACWGAPTYEATQPPTGRFVSVSLGYSHGCALGESGSLDCWGWAGHGAIEPPAGPTAAYDLGYHFGCALDVEGTIGCWGKDLSNGNIEPPAGRFADLDVGAMFGCALPTVPGVPVCWGENGLGQASPPETELTVVSLGSGHGCGIRPDTTLVCWGDDVHGQATPPDGPGWVRVSAGAHHACAVDADGWLACWGWNESSRASPPE